jgi:hypothetical protein
MIFGDCINTSLNNAWDPDVMINTNRRDVIILQVKQRDETFSHIETSLFSIISAQVIGFRTMAIRLFNDSVSIVDVINPVCTAHVVKFRYHIFFFPSSLLPHLLLLLEHRAEFPQFLDQGQSVGLLGRVISSSQGLYLYTNTEKRTHIHKH